MSRLREGRIFLSLDNKTDPDETGGAMIEKKPSTAYWALDLYRRAFSTRRG